jgi:hypothetical protein
MMDEALGRIEDLINSCVAFVPALLVGLVVFSLGLLIARGVRAAVTRAAMMRDASAASAAVLGRIASGTARLIAFLIDALDGAVESVKRALTEAGIDLPFPTTQVLFHDQTEETDGNRALQREGWPAGNAKPPRQQWRIIEENRKLAARGTGEPE